MCSGTHPSSIEDRLCGPHPDGVIRTDIDDETVAIELPEDRVQCFLEACDGRGLE